MLKVENGRMLIYKYKGGCVQVEKDLLESEAWRSLRGRAGLLYMAMLQRRVFGDAKDAKADLEVVNHRKLVYTYPTARKELGMSRNGFNSSMRELVEKGFVDYVEVGYGPKQCNKYGISLRWRNFSTSNTSNFVKDKELERRKQLRADFKKLPKAEKERAMRNRYYSAKK